MAIALAKGFKNESFRQVITDQTSVITDQTSVLI